MGTTPPFPGCPPQANPKEGDMGVGDQFACASLVAAFSLALFITGNLFVESRSSKSIVLMPATHQMRIIPL
jgi:hypothetical protein